MKVRLGDIATYINGYAFKPTDWGDVGLQIIRIQNLTGNAYQVNKFNGSIDKKYEINFGDVLISWSASLGVYVWKGDKAVLNQHIFKVVFDKCEVNKNFFVYQVQTILDTAVNEAHGATMKHLTKPVFDALPFYLPSKNEQDSIAEKLDYVNNLIGKRKQQLEKLDLLVKSQFIEMFGDPVKNPKSFQLMQLSDLGDWSSGGTPSRTKMEYFKGEIDWYSAGELNEMFLEDSQEKITQAAIEESAAKIFSRGSLLIGMYDTAAFKMGILQKESASNQACACITPNSKVNILWLYFILQIMKIYFLKNRRGIRQKNLNLGMIKGFKIPVPPLELQNEFARFVEQTDKSKLRIKQSLEKLETLKKSLMQKYFG